MWNGCRIFRAGAMRPVLNDQLVPFEEGRATNCPLCRFLSLSPDPYLSPWCGRMRKVRAPRGAYGVAGFVPARLAKTTALSPLASHRATILRQSSRLRLMPRRLRRAARPVSYATRRTDTFRRSSRPTRALAISTRHLHRCAHYVSHRLGGRIQEDDLQLDEAALGDDPASPCSRARRAGRRRAAGISGPPAGSERHRRTSGKADAVGWSPADADSRQTRLLCGGEGIDNGSVLEATPHT
jgi:hypothetical protein